MLVRRGEHVARGLLIDTIGTAHGRDVAHLHFEIRKNLAIGINQSAFPSDLTCYYDPTAFIASHRPREVASAAEVEGTGRFLMSGEDRAVTTGNAAERLQLNRAAALSP